MNQKDLVEKVYGGLKGRFPDLTKAMTDAVVNQALMTIVSTTVQGEPAEFKGLFSLRPTVHLRNKKLKYQKEGHTVVLVVRLRMGSIFKRTFQKYKDVFTEVVEWKELPDGKTGLQAKFRATGGVVPRQDGDSEPPVPLVRGGDDRAAAELPDPWLRALRGEE
jgi:hypothetical protein